MNHTKISLPLVGFCLLIAADCKKRVATVPPPPTPAASAKETTPRPSKPVISLFVADPASIVKGHSSTLRWVVDHASEVTISPGVGLAQSSGSRDVFPTTNTTYTLLAKGPGGMTSATTSVSVMVPPPPKSVSPPPRTKTISERLSSEVQDAYFDFDKSAIRQDARAALKADAVALKAIFHDFPTATATVEGHCDERGSAEYNLALGDRRARAAKDFLVEFGVPTNRLKPISYGKEKPQCFEHNEECWQKNRRVHFSPSS